MPTLKLLDSYTDLDPAAWDALVADGSPFLEHAFLAGLERFGCAVPETGWRARPVTLYEGDTLVAAAPAWIKTHSMGEFVYDHAWADAAEGAGIPYYPKLVVAVPFTPVSGSRLLVHPLHDPATLRPLLLQGLAEAARGLAGLHVLFNPAEESEWLSQRNGFRRSQFQFHWHNHGYTDFDGFLARFKSKSRNKIRRERRDAQRYQIDAFTAPDHEMLDALHGFHSQTCAQYGPWGRVYLSRDFFRYLGEVWGERLHVVSARDGDRLVAGCFNVLKGDRLYGRYWGGHDPAPFLHFECCYYRPVQEAIARGLAVFEPGHGGQHKYRRGFMPALTWSNHWLAEPRLHAALRAHCAEERRLVTERAAALRARSPLVRAVEG